MGDDFAKLFVSGTYGQILVVIDTDSEHDFCPCVSFSVSPPGFGVCATKMHFKDTDSGWAAAQKRFDGCDMEMAEAAAKVVFSAAYPSGHQPSEPNS